MRGGVHVGRRRCRKKGIWGGGDVGRRGCGEMNGSEGEDKKARVPAGRVAEAQGSKDG